MIVALAAVIGLLCGSFANVLIARVPAGEQWAKGSSRCPQCHQDIAWFDNIPILSWLVLRGRCRNCGWRIPMVYPLVELATAVMFALVAAVFGLSLLTPTLAYLALISVVLVVIDLRHFRLPDALVLPSIAVVAAGLIATALVEGDPGRLLLALAGAGILGGFYFLMWLVYPSGLGFGDVKTALLLGLPLGFLGWGALAVGGILGPFVAVFFAIGAMLKAKAVKGVRLAYGPGLIIGAWIGILAGSVIATAYVGLLIR